MGDLMVLQQAQMHQLLMQKMLLRDMDGGCGLLGSRNTHSSCSSHHHGHHHGHHHHGHAHHHGCSCEICVPVVPVNFIHSRINTCFYTVELNVFVED